jgi:uncharacterized membrane protein HdeD (DUF308 family)
MTIQNPTSNRKPGKVQAIAIMTLVDGILNILYVIALVIQFIVGALGTYGLTLFCLPIAFLPLVVGILEIVGGAKLLNTPGRRVRVGAIGVLEIINVISLFWPSLVIGILNLVFYNDPEVKNYINSLPA